LAKQAKGFAHRLRWDRVYSASKQADSSRVSFSFLWTWRGSTGISEQGQHQLLGWLTHWDWCLL